MRLVTNQNGAHRKTLGKNYSLKKQSEISALFASGKTFKAYPVKFFLSKAPVTGSGVKYRVLFSVSKRRHRKAVDRNKLKRRIREAFRLHRNELDIPNSGFIYYIGFLYMSSKILPFQDIEKSIKDLITQINDEIHK